MVTELGTVRTTAPLFDRLWRRVNMYIGIGGLILLILVLILIF